MRNKLKLSLWLLAATLLPSCSGSEEPDVPVGSTLSLNVTTLEFGQEGGSQTVAVTSNAEWTVSTSAEWISVSPSEGSGNGTIVVTVAPNNERQERWNIVTVQNGVKNLTSLNIYQRGTDTSDHYLLVDDMQERCFSGTVGATDSIYIESNTLWTVKGPAWLTAWDSVERRNKSLAQEVRGSGSGWLLLTLNKTNAEDDDLSSTISVTSARTTQKAEVPAVVLGRNNVRPYVKLLLTDCLTYTVKAGSEVERLYNQVFYGSPTENEKSEGGFASWSGGRVADMKVTFLKDNLTDGTAYTLCCVGANSKGAYGKVGSTSLTTPTLAGQPLAKISSTAFRDGKWHWNVKMNDKAKGYYQYIVVISTKEYSKSNIADNFREKLPDGLTLREKDASWSLNGDDDVAIATWAVGEDGQLAQAIDLVYCHRNATNNQ